MAAMVTLMGVKATGIGVREEVGVEVEEALDVLDANAAASAHLLRRLGRRL